MKKLISIAAVAAAIAVAPTMASADSWRHHRGHHQGDTQQGYYGHDNDSARAGGALVVIGTGAGAGALIAGPVGAAVGAGAGLVVAVFGGSLG